MHTAPRKSPHTYLLFHFMQLWGLLWLHCLAVKSNGISSKRETINFTSVDILSNIENWQKDMAIMFYADWCINCL
jgi:thiol:disulfide interchange protein